MGTRRKHSARVPRRDVRRSCPAPACARSMRPPARRSGNTSADGQRASEDARDLRRSRLLHRPRQHARRARRANRRGALGNEDGRRLDVGADRRRRQGADGAHLRAAARELLRRRARCEDREGSLEVLHRGRRRRPGRQDVGRRARSDARRRPRGDCPAATIPFGGSIYWGVANPTPNTRTVRHGGNPDAIPTFAPADLVQQFDRRAESRHRQARVVLPAPAGRRLGRGLHARAHAVPHRRQPRSEVREVDQPRRPPRPAARRRW